MRNNLKELSFLNGGNSIFVEELYAKFINDPNSVDKEWREYFSHMKAEDNFPNSAINFPSWQSDRPKIIGQRDEVISAEKSKQVSNKEVTNLSHLFRHILSEFRSKGHLITNLDPLNLEQRNLKIESDLSLEGLGVSNSDAEKSVELGSEFAGFNNRKILDIYKDLRKIYCSTVSYEISHIACDAQKQWLFEQIENNQEEINNSEKTKILQDLIEIEHFEQFLHSRFPGAKRFSVEGGESSIIAANEVIRVAREENDVEEYIIGMAHRGRLNTLTKIMQKPYKAVLSEFQGNVSKIDDIIYSGDVKYHLGKSSDIEFREGKKIHLSLTPNPSHLEAVNPVVQGKVRAKQDLKGDKDRIKIAGMLIHGDAAFAGQGVVAESLSIGDLEAYETGGSMHIVINNQIGFTTEPVDARKSRYPTEFAKIIQAPVIHVNADDVESVIKVARLAERFRRKFKKDIVIDIVCYRKYGHNEGDEPMFTNPIMYERIKNTKSVTEKYAENLIAGKVINSQQFQDMVKDFIAFLDKEYKEGKNYKQVKAEWLEGKWNNFEQYKKHHDKQATTGVDLKKLKDIGNQLTKVPEGFVLNSKIQRLLETKKEMFAKGKNFDWGTAEALAFGSLLTESYPIRMTGQDCKRGTFSHRHAVLFDQKNENEYIPLNHLSSGQAKLDIYNSNLSEFAVLGFEYGYSTVDPKHLTIWEAQFGDFANGAQIIIDQFISSAEFKWLRMSGLVMLLPHGYEGQGPEHSSARLERFLQLCAEGNMQVLNCTTPANYFHALRRQIIGRNYRKPLIVMSPKSLLRHKLAISNLEEMGPNTSFSKVYDHVGAVDKNKVKKILICSGKIYYDLMEKKEKIARDDVAIIRIEQYYPFPKEELSQILSKYNKSADIIWCQEEPKNMGAWKFICHEIEDVMVDLDFKASRIQYVGRVKSASTASGYLNMHNIEQENIVSEALK